MVSPGGLTARAVRRDSPGASWSMAGLRTMRGTQPRPGKRRRQISRHSCPPPCWFWHTIPAFPGRAPRRSGQGQMGRSEHERGPGRTRPPGERAGSPPGSGGSPGGGWTRPSFGKQLFLGDFRLDLIHPHPRPSEESSRRGEEFCARLREFCETSVDAALIERDARIPGEVVRRRVGTAVAWLVPRADGLLQGWRNRQFQRYVLRQRWCRLVPRCGFTFYGSSAAPGSDEHHQQLERADQRQRGPCADQCTHRAVADVVRQVRADRGDNARAQAPGG